MIRYVLAALAALLTCAPASAAIVYDLDVDEYNPSAALSADLPNGTYDIEMTSSMQALLRVYYFVVYRRCSPVDGGSYFCMRYSGGYEVWNDYYATPDQPLVLNGFEAPNSIRIFDPNSSNYDEETRRYRFMMRIENAPAGSFARLTIQPVPEPGAWAMMIVGFAAVGGALRAGRRLSFRPQVSA
jgi:hypothetical protein